VLRRYPRVAIAPPAVIVDGEYRLLPGVGAGLQRRRQAGVKVVATTNFAVGLREPLLAVTGLALHVEDAVSTEEADDTEPQPLVIESATRPVVGPVPAPTPTHLMA
jgi:phosphoglycolate phosphatase-like HAD superfamily hydrolase